jgi:O-antigen ligase
LCIASVAFISPSAITFILSTIAGTKIDSALGIAFLMFVGILIVTYEHFDRKTLTLLVPIALIVFYFLLTGTWSESYVYYNSKTTQLITIVPSFYYTGTYLGRHPETLLKFWKAFVAIGFVLSVVALVVGLDTASSYEDFGGDAANVGYQSLSRFLGLSIAAALSLMLGGRSSRLSYFLLALFCALSAYVVISSGGRTGILIVAVFLFALVVLLPKSQWIRLIIGSLIGLFGVVLLSADLQGWIDGYANSADLPASIQRIIFYLSYRSIDLQVITRDFLHEQAIQIWKQNPVWGVGWAQFPISAGIGDVIGMYPHNFVLELLAETGVIGCTIFLGFMALTITKFYRFRSDNYVLWVLLMGWLSASIAIALSISDLAVQREMYLCLGILGGYSLAANERRKSIMQAQLLRRHIRLAK